MGDFKKKFRDNSKADEDSKIPIFVGGTMMYFYSLFEGLADLPPRDDLIETRVKCRFEKLLVFHLYFKDLRKLIRGCNFKIHHHDTQRILRALEVCNY